MTARIVQLTDLHLFADPCGEVRGVRTRETFERVLAAVNEFHADADRLIITGDLTHDEQLATYEFLRARLEYWLPKLRVIPGNHDDRGLMRAVFGDRITPLGERNDFVDEVAGWRLIGLDSQVPGKLHGELGAEQLAWLHAQLQEQVSTPTCVFQHHPPLEIGSAWLDRIALQDAAAFRAAASRYPQLRAVICGHVHQERTVLENHVAYFTTPSTGVQFRPETATLEVDAAAPGFRVIDLLPEGSLHARVQRIG